VTRASAALALLACACAPTSRRLAVVPALPDCLGATTINEVRVSALGDFAVAPAYAASATASGSASLDLPSGTRVIAVDGFGPGGLAAFGRTAPLALDALATTSVAVAYGPPDTLCPTGAMHYTRAGHRATRLTSGDVIVSGGVTSDGFAVPRLELYVPAGDAETPPASFRVVDPGGSTVLSAQAALGHAVAALPAGGFLISGGAPADAGLAHGNVYQGWTLHDGDGVQIGSVNVFSDGGRAFHAATTLADGRVLLTGGCDHFASGACDGNVLDTSALYDPAIGGFTDGPRLLHARWDHDAILRGDGSLLLVGGHGATGDPPAEIVDPSEARAFEAGVVSGRAVLDATGTVLVAGGASAPSRAAALWLSADDVALDEPPLDPARAGHTVTALDDGTRLLVGGGGPPVLYDPLGGARALAGADLTRHAATLLLDGSVLVTGGVGGGAAASTAAAIFLHTPLGPFTTPTSLTFDGGDPYQPRRYDRATVAVDATRGAHLRVTAPMPGEGGRPGELALIAGARVADFDLRLRAGRDADGAAALLFGVASDASYVYVALTVGQPVQASVVSVARPGLSMVSPVAACSGAALTDAELPDGGLAELALAWRGGVLSVATNARLLLQCAPGFDVARGAVGVGSLGGTVRFDDLTLER
jgi:hypothetical protein